MTTEHAMKQTDQSTTYYPDHPPRVATDVYVRSPHELVVVQDKPCWACGVRHSDVVKGGPNLAAGLALETHHFWTEDAFTGEGRGLGGIYWPRVQSDHPTFDWQGSGFVLEDPATWKFFVDSPFNLQVLCSQCHRAAKSVPHWLAGKPDVDRGGLVWTADAGSVGIHHVTYPMYRDQRHSRPDVPPFRTALTAPPPIPAHVIAAADAAAVAQLAKTPLLGHTVTAPVSAA